MRARERDGGVHIACERPSADVTTVAHGHLEVCGRVWTPAALDSVRIELDGKRTRLTDVVAVDGDGHSGTVHRFRIRIKTKKRSPGPRAIEITATDVAGNHASCRREVDLQPFDKQSGETTEAALEAGRTTMGVDLPRRGAVLLGDYFTVRGWAYCPQGIREVVAFADGILRQDVRLGFPRPELAARFGLAGLADAGFLLGLDLSGWSRGPHRLTVIAYGRDGRTVGRESHFSVGADEAARRALRVVPRPTPDAGRSAPAPAHSLTICPLAEDEALESSLSVQSVDSAAIERPGDLFASLRALAQRRDGHQLLLEAGTRLEPGAVEAVLGAAGAGADLIYGDEESPPPREAESQPYLKPSWSPELLLATDYLGPMVAVSARAARAALDADPAPVESIYELALRLADPPLSIEHVPAVLLGCDGAGRADAARARRAIERLSAIRGRGAQVTELGPPGCRHVSWTLDELPPVSIVLLTGGRSVAQDCVRSIREHTTYENFELVIVDASGHGAAERLVPLAGDIPVRVVSHDGPFHYCTASNLGARQARGDHLLFLNDDIEVRSPDWIERMVEQSVTPGVGVVGAKLLYPDDTLQHCGVMLGGGSVGPRHMFRGMRSDVGGYRELLRLTRNCSAVTAACMMVGAELFWELDGFDEALVVEFNDTDICLRALERGARVVWTPRAVLTHYEQLTRGGAKCPPDHATFAARWGGRFPRGDPFYHPALSQTRDYVLAAPVDEAVQPRAETTAGDP